MDVCESYRYLPLRAFFERPEYADSNEPLLTWHGHVLKAKWQIPADVKADFGTASILKRSRTDDWPVQQGIRGA
jgi:mRNA-degrading endonuclease HigB of HigAB toxin-antitoxin module